MALTIRIAMLNADTPVPSVFAKHGSYGNIFHKLLVASAKRLSTPACPIVIESEEFDIVKGEYPTSPALFDCLLITGAVSAAYDDEPWIHQLDQYIADIYRDYSGVKMFGSCFGHQIMCQSLLRDHGVIVEKDPNGYELGVHEIQLTEEFANALGGSKKNLRKTTERIPTPDVEVPSLHTPDSSLSKNTLNLQFIHADHVKLPDTSPGLPPSWVSIGRSKHCALQGVYQPGRILTYQGHFEFDRFVNSETAKVFGAKWDPTFLQNSLDAMDNDDDSLPAADMVVRFLLEGKGVSEMGDGGLITPPVKA